MTNKVMNDATRKKLMGLLPFAPGSFARVTLKEFDGVDPEFVPVFFLRAFSTETMATYRINMAASGAVVCDVFRQALSESGIVGWENLRDFVTGEQIPFSKEAVKSLLLDSLASALFSKCSEFTFGPTPEEKTGLESSPPPTSEQ